jgi:D-glycero-D-manno-heptose 1,7-bisphosphate phosphatase
MLLEGIEEFELEPAQCWFLGDSQTDAEAGRRAGVHTALVGDHPDESAEVVAPNLQAMLDLLRARL